MILDMSVLTDKVAIITGGSRGLEAARAAFAQAGADHGHHRSSCRRTDPRCRYAAPTPLPPIWPIEVTARLAGQAELSGRLGIVVNSIWRHQYPTRC